MKTILPLLWVGLGCLFGCEFHYSTARIDQLRLCEQAGEAGRCETSSDLFSPQSPQFTASCQLSGAPSGTRVVFHWYYLQAQARQLIDSVVFHMEEGNSAAIRASLSAPHQGWPEGVYEVRARVQTDNGNQQTQTFSVQASAPSARGNASQIQPHLPAGF